MIQVLDRMQEGRLDIVCAGRVGAPRETCEVTGEQLFRASEYVASGEYIERETRRYVNLAVADYLPARLDGQVACYCLVRHDWA